MPRTRALAGALLALWLVVGGCTTLREIPRSDFAQLPSRKGVRVETSEGLVYDFDYVTVSGDSLTGFRHRIDLEGPVDQTVDFRIALDDIHRVTARQFDWARTGIVGGSVLAGVLAVGLANNTPKTSTGGSTSGGGKGGIN